MVYLLQMVIFHGYVRSLQAAAARGGGGFREPVDLTPFEKLGMTHSAGVRPIYPLVI